jgi:hypothetical protein
MRAARFSLLCLLAVGLRLAAIEPERPVALVNGVPVTVREFVEAQQRLRFRFERDPEGLRAAALAECVDFQIRLQLAHGRGLVAGTDEPFVREAYAAENERRAGAKSAGQPVYGPVRLTWSQFRRYWLDGIERQVLEAINREAGPESAAELEKFHAAHPALFTPPGAKAPQPLNELEGHVRDQYRLARYRQIIREAVIAAVIERHEALLATLEPTTPL